MNERWKAYGGATLIASAVIASSVLLRGWTGKSWVDAVLYMVLGWYMASFIMPFWQARPAGNDSDCK